MNGIFQDKQGRPRRLHGVGIVSGSARLAELAALIGFETVWIEMEHGSAPDFSLVESLCIAAQAGGAMPTVRVPDAQRHHVMRALEVGAQIVVVPMVNTATQARQIVEYGKFPPLGARGYNTRSRGIEYGLAGVLNAFEAANARTHLFAQIETMEAVENLDDICAVEGLSGIFIGPGDLSVSVDCPGDMNNEQMINVVTDCLHRARAAGKRTGILVAPGALLDAALKTGCDLVFCGSDVGDLIGAWQRLLASVSTLQEKAHD